jgi:cystathionine gamma-synthase
MAGDKEVKDQLQSDYPRYNTDTFAFGKCANSLTLCCRFYQHASVQKLNEAVLERIEAPQHVHCAIFPSEDGMRRCSEYLRNNTDIIHPIQELLFSLALDSSKENATWARFCAVIYPEQSTQSVEEFWGFMGDGISSRHAEFCFERFSFMDSVSSDSGLRTFATSDDAKTLLSETWDFSDSGTKDKIKGIIAKSVTSQKPGQAVVRTQDVFLYLKGMCAIGTVARALAPASSHSSEAVIFG